MSRHLISHLIRSSCVTRNACRLLLRCLPPTVLWYVPVVLYSVHPMNSPTCSKYIPTCNYKVFRSSIRLTSALFQCLSRILPIFSSLPPSTPTQLADLHRMSGADCRAASPPLSPPRPYTAQMRLEFIQQPQVAPHRRRLEAALLNRHYVSSAAHLHLAIETSMDSHALLVPSIFILPETNSMPEHG